MLHAHKERNLSYTRQRLTENKSRWSLIGVNARRGTVDASTRPHAKGKRNQSINTQRGYLMPLVPKRRVLLPLLFIATVLFQHPCLAATQAVTSPDGDSVILFKPQVPYSQASTISDSIKQECALNEAMVASIQKYAKVLAIPLVSEEEAHMRPGIVRELSVQITQATPGVFAFFNMFSKPAILAIDFKLTEGGKVILEKSRTCATKHAGFLGMDGRVCAKLIKCANDQGAYVNKWIQKLDFKDE